MAIVLDGTANTVTPLNGALGGTTPSTVAATTITASGTITATGGITVGATAAPAFSAYLASNQSVTSATWTKVQCNTEEFDTNSNYNTTNYRFTPTVAGYYQVSAGVDVSSSGSTTSQTLAIQKNGSFFKVGMVSKDSLGRVGMSTLIFLNGSTDYIELFAAVTGVSLSFAGSNTYTYFQAAMVRST